MSSYKIQRYIVDEGKYDRMLMTNDIEGAKPKKFTRELNLGSQKVSRSSQTPYEQLPFPLQKKVPEPKFIDSLDNLQEEFQQKKQKDPNLQKNLEQFFAVDNEKKPYAMKKSLVKFFDSPYSQMGTLKNKDPTIFAQNPEIFKRNLDPYPYINPNQNPNTSNSQYVSNAMNQERAKIRSHENKMQFFFEKNIEDYAKPLQKQDQIFKKTLIDSQPPIHNNNENQENPQNLFKNKSAIYSSGESKPPILQKIFQYDFLSNRVLTKKEPVRNPKANFYGIALKSLYEDNNPVIYSHNLQNNIANDTMNSKKKVFAGLENDYCEIPKKVYDPKVHEPMLNQNVQMFGVKALKNLDNLKIC